MERSEFVTLRWSVEADLRKHIRDESLITQITNDVMRTLLTDLCRQEVKRQRNNRKFLTFRRDPDITPPAWAYRKPGIDRLN